MERLARRIKDKRLLWYIRQMLKAGMMDNEGVCQSREQGTPQGGPLSPLLANILLDELDRELERRGLRFCRYADDCIIFVKTMEAGHRAKKLLDSHAQACYRRPCALLDAKIAFFCQTKGVSVPFHTLFAQMKTHLPLLLRKALLGSIVATSTVSSFAVADELQPLTNEVTEWTVVAPIPSYTRDIYFFKDSDNVTQTWLVGNDESSEDWADLFGFLEGTTHFRLILTPEENQVPAIAYWTASDVYFGPYDYIEIQADKGIDISDSLIMLSKRGMLTGTVDPDNNLYCNINVRNSIFLDNSSFITGWDLSASTLVVKDGDVHVHDIKLGKADEFRNKDVTWDWLSNATEYGPTTFEEIGEEKGCSILVQDYGNIVANTITTEGKVIIHNGSVFADESAFYGDDVILKGLPETEGDHRACIGLTRREKSMEVRGNLDVQYGIVRGQARGTMTVGGDIKVGEESLIEGFSVISCKNFTLADGGRVTEHAEGAIDSLTCAESCTLAGTDWTFALNTLSVGQEHALKLSGNGFVLNASESIETGSADIRDGATLTTPLLHSHQATTVGNGGAIVGTGAITCGSFTMENGGRLADFSGSLSSNTFCTMEGADQTISLKSLSVGHEDALSLNGNNLVLNVTDAVEAGSVVLKGNSTLSAAALQTYKGIQAEGSSLKITGNLCNGTEETARTEEEPINLVFKDSTMWVVGSLNNTVGGLSLTKSNVRVDNAMSLGSTALSGTLVLNNGSSLNIVRNVQLVGPSAGLQVSGGSELRISNGSYEVLAQKGVTVDGEVNDFISDSKVYVEYQYTNEIGGLNVSHSDLVSHNALSLAGNLNVINGEQNCVRFSNGFTISGSMTVEGGSLIAGDGFDTSFAPITADEGVILTDVQKATSSTIRVDNQSVTSDLLAIIGAIVVGGGETGKIVADIIGVLDDWNRAGITLTDSNVRSLGTLSTSGEIAISGGIFNGVELNADSENLISEIVRVIGTKLLPDIKLGERGITAAVTLTDTDVSLSGQIYSNGNLSVGNTVLSAKNMKSTSSELASVSITGGSTVTLEEGLESSGAVSVENSVLRMGGDFSVNATDTAISILESLGLVDVVSFVDSEEISIGGKFSSNSSTYISSTTLTAKEMELASYLIASDLRIVNGSKVSIEGAISNKGSILIDGSQVSVGKGLSTGEPTLRPGVTVTTDITINNHATVEVKGAVESADDLEVKSGSQLIVHNLKAENGETAASGDVVAADNVLVDTAEIRAAGHFSAGKEVTVKGEGAKLSVGGNTTIGDMLHIEDKGIVTLNGEALINLPKLEMVNGELNLLNADGSVPATAYNLVLNELAVEGNLNTVEGNLVMRDNATLTFGEGALLTMGCDVTLGSGTALNLEGDYAHTFIDLFAGVDSLTLAGEAITHDGLYDVYGTIGTLNGDFIDRGQYVIGYRNGVVSFGAGTVPEPATATLSLLALAALAARRRRK